MAYEIERKFLVCGDTWRELATEQAVIRQAYLKTDGKASIRVRIKNATTATLTIKSRAPDLRRLELEYSIPVLEAEALLQLREGAVIDKVRHVIPWGNLAWEVDVFAGENSGLVIAEIELRDPQQRFETPDWIGAEVTGQPQYYNSSLCERPFRWWGGRGETAAVTR